MKTIITIISAACLFILASCSASKNTVATAPLITYSGNVKAIIDNNCASTCHNATRPAAGIDLTHFESVQQQTLYGKLIPAIQHAEGAVAMPKKAPKLDDASIQVIVDWAGSGAAN